MDKVLDPMCDVDRLYVLRKERERRLTSIEDNVDASIQRLTDYLRRCRVRLITATRNSTKRTRTITTEIIRKQKREVKQHSGRFKRPASDISRKNVDVTK